MKHIYSYIHQYGKTVGYTLVCQLIIFGIQWPILMAWGYAVHPLSLIGNAVCMPLISIVIILVSGIFFCVICGIPCQPLFTGVTYVIDLWMYLISVPIDDMHYTCACPHWSVLCAIPIVTCLIAWSSATLRYAIVYMTIFFCITAYSLATWYTPHAISVHRNVSIIPIDKRPVVWYRPCAPRARYTDNWIMYTLIPELRKQFGTERIHGIVWHTQTPRSLRRKLRAHGVHAGPCVSILHLIGNIARRRTSGTAHSSARCDY